MFLHFLFSFILLFYRNVNKKWKKVLEVSIVCSTTVTISFLLILYSGDCKKLGLDPTEHPIQVVINKCIQLNESLQNVMI